jgi:hypothetical protein
VKLGGAFVRASWTLPSGRFQLAFSEERKKGIWHLTKGSWCSHLGGVSKISSAVLTSGRIVVILSGICAFQGLSEAAW